MKKKLLYFMLLIVSLSYAQIPINGLLAQYEFTNGSITDNVNNISFTKTGTASTNITDRFGNTNQAMSLNGDDLTRPDINFDVTSANPFLPKTISFWLKTTTNDGNVRIIYNDNDQTSMSDVSFIGLTVFLQNGKINAANKVGANGNLLTHSKVITDNKWHHIVVQAYSEFTTTGVGGSFLRYIAVDGDKLGGSGYITTSFAVNVRTNKHTGNISISRLKTTSLPVNNKYEDGIDDVLIYSRILSDAEIGAMASDRNEIVYTNIAASGGSNDGTSWANAYTSLSNAISSALPGSEIWVANGNYKPHVSDRDFRFNVTQPNLKIYGGFAGTETSISQRILGTNETILSGDLQNNDINTTDFISNYSNTTRNTDNSYHIINIASTANNLVLDGLTISGAHNNKSTIEKGGAILKNKSVAKLTLKNCTIKDNVSRNDNAGVFAEYHLNNTSTTRGELNIENCKFINNMARWASGVYSYTGATNTYVDVTITNCLFDKNIAGDLNSGAATGLSGSAGWIRMIGNNCDFNVNVVNNTFANNITTGTNNGLNASTHAVLGISLNSGKTGTLNTTAANNIFWGNRTGNNITKSITDLYLLPVTSVNVYNSIDEDGFSDNSLTSTTNTTTANPSFTSVTDYTLLSGSPAIDTGDNLKLPTGITQDLAGEQRIFNTTVDMGAFEYNSTLSTDNPELNKNQIKLYPNPTTSVLNIEIKQGRFKQAKIYSIMGSEVLKTMSNTINIKKLKIGIYLIKVEDETGIIVTKRFVKQ